MEKRLLHPNQFQVNEAWIVFRLNDEPIRTERDGSFHVAALMDAASCFIFGTEFISSDVSERALLPFIGEARRSFEEHVQGRQGH